MLPGSTTPYRRARVYRSSTLGRNLKSLGRNLGRIAKQEGTRIAQGRRVGELESELYVLAVSGQLHDLVKRVR